MAEQPPLSRIHVVGYSANDRDFPILNLVLDPRVAGYRVPEDLSACPDKRYPNHVFTGAQPISGDQRVRHVWEILPSPWVPFTRYDDDLGPVQGRRRSVKNEGQVASLTADKRTTYEAREGSAIVYTELEETWSIATDEDGNSLFPIRDRDFYDPSRGPVQERRQLFVPTGEEEGSLENVNGVITQTSYEPYNEFLSVKIVQTYKVDGPQLIGKATDNDGQLVTVTTQRKGADGYIPPNPTATRTVEVSREDAESLVERIVDTPEIFKANTFSVERPDPIPQKFRVAVPIRSSQEIVEGTAVTPTLSEGEISKSEEQRNKFIKRLSATSRDQTVLPQTLTGKTTNNDRQEVTVTETLQLGNTDESPTATTTIESEALGDGNYVITKTEVPEVFGAETYRKTREDITPQKFKAAQADSTVEQNVAGIASPTIALAEGEFAKSEQQINKFVKRVSTTSRTITEAVTLLEKVLTNEGQIGTRVLTLDSGDQSFVPSALMVDASVEALGDGRTVKTETTVPQVFSGKTIQKSRIDLTPEKFRAAQEDTTTEETVAGTVNPDIDLGAGEFRKSEQQVTQFVKRISTNSRDISAATNLKEFVLTPQGQLAERTLRLSSTPQSIQPSALLIDGSIEELGDGRTIKTEVKVDKVFGNLVYSIERPDPAPLKFRADLPTSTVSVNSAGTPSVPTISGNELAKSEEQVTEFVKRVSTTSRAASGGSLSGSVYTTELGGGVATLSESFGQGVLISPSFGTVSASLEPLGGGNSLAQEVKLSTPLPELNGQEYDPTFDLVVPYTQQFIQQGSSSNIASSEVVPRDIFHSLKRTYKSGSASINDVITTYEQINITLPDVLEEIRLFVNYDPSNDSASGSGDTCSASGSATVSTEADLYYEIKTGYSGPIDAEKKIFFMKKADATKTKIYRKLGTGVKPWPILKPQEKNIIVSTLSKKSHVSTSVSLPQNASLGTSSDVDRNWKFFTIRPTLNSFKQIQVTISGSPTATATARAGLGSGVSATATGSYTLEPKSFLSTEPSSFPEGKYVYSLTTTPYRYGLIRVEALIVDITDDYL